MLNFNARQFDLKCIFDQFATIFEIVESFIQLNLLNIENMSEKQNIIVHIIPFLGKFRRTSVIIRLLS